MLAIIKMKILQSKVKQLSKIISLKVNGALHEKYLVKTTLANINEIYELAMDNLNK